MLRRLIDPIMLHSEPRPDFIRWEAPTKTNGLLDGIENGPSIRLASPTGDLDMDHLELALIGATRRAA